MSDRYALLIVGGGPAGLAAARAFRDAGGTGTVAIVADEQRMPYQRPPLTKELLRGESGEDELPLEDESWLRRRGVSLIAGRATALDADERTIMLSGGRALPYRQCLLATGSEPTRLPIPGVDDPSVRVVRTLEHVRELRNRLAPGDPVIVIGSGFIGCEIAGSLALRGNPVTLVSDESLPNEARLGERAGGWIADWLRDGGVVLRGDMSVDAIERRDDGLHLICGAEELNAPVIVMATGVSPRGELFGAIEPLVDGAIPVDASLRSVCPGVLAAGDVALADNATAGRALRVEHWGDALAQGAVAGQSAAGERRSWDEVPGFWSTIGRHTLKYAAWGDGYDSARVEPDSGENAFTVWYERDGRLVGVLTHEVDANYERGRELIAEGAPSPR